MKFELNKENAPFIAQAFATNSTNAKAIIRQKYPITDEEYKQIYANWDFDQLKSYLPKKEKKKTFYEDKKLLKQAGSFIDSKNKSVSYPFDEIKEEHQVSVRNLQSIGFTIQHTTF